LWVLYKEPSGHIVIKLLGTLWKNSKGSFTKYPLGTLWTLRQRMKGVCSKSTHWVLCWVLFESAHHLPAGYEPGKLMGTFWKRSILTCWVFRWVNWWVLFKSAHFLPTGFGLGELVGTFWKRLLFICWVWAGRIVSEPTMNSQCTHWVYCPLPPVIASSSRRLIELITHFLFGNARSPLLTSGLPLPSLMTDPLRGSSNVFNQCITYIIIILLAYSKIAAIEICKIKYEKNTRAWRISNTVDPAKCGLKRTRIERDTPNFCPEKERTFPAHRADWWDWSRLPFWERVVSPLAPRMQSLPSHFGNQGHTPCPNILLGCFYVWLFTVYILFCNHRTFENRVFLQLVLWVRISITLAPKILRCGSDHSLVTSHKIHIQLACNCR